MARHLPPWIGVEYRALLRRQPAKTATKPDTAASVGVDGIPAEVPIERMGPGPYDPVAKEVLAEVASARAPLDFPVPAHALAEIADLRKQLADAQAVADGKTLAQLTASMPKTEAGRISELAAVRADRDRLEQINDRLRRELAERIARIGNARTEIARQDTAASNAMRPGFCDVSDALAAVERHLVDPQYRPTRTRETAAT